MSKKEISSGTEKAESLARNGKNVKKTSVKSEKKVAPVKDENVKNSVSKSVKADKNVKVKKSDDKKPSVKKGKNRVKQISEKKRKKREAREQKKLEAAKIRAEKKQKRLEKKLAAKQKRLERIAAMKERKAERRERRRERRDMLRHETKEARIERKREERAAKAEAKVAKREAALADKRAKREHRLKVRAEKRAAQSEKRHAPGFGGWLATVIALGVTTLALGTMLTFGWINMNGIQADVADIHTESLYELNSIVDNLDTNLAKARVASTRGEQVKLLSNIAIESETAETVIERLPMETRLTQNMSSFVNKMGDSAQSMLFAVANGKKLTDSQIATIEHMYNTNLEMKRIINELTSEANGSDMLAAMRGKDDGLMYVTFGEIENKQFETPKEIHDGPFAENIDKVSAKNLEGLKEITASDAEKLCKKYFNDYNVKNANCTGETNAEQLGLYNVTLETDDGEMSAQISKQGGKVVEFNSFKDCNDKNFSVERCIDIAEDFLSSLGFNGMKAVWTSENGTTCNLNFANVQNGVVIYSDMVKVKVCEQRGIVTGMEALSYVLNHTEREIPAAKISKAEAEKAINDAFDVESSRLCLIPAEGAETLCYEFFGTYEGRDYYIYIDATNGNETEVFTVVGTKQGQALM